MNERKGFVYAQAYAFWFARRGRGELKDETFSILTCTLLFLYSEIKFTQVLSYVEPRAIYITCRWYVKSVSVEYSLQKDSNRKSEKKKFEVESCNLEAKKFLDFR